MYNIVKWMVMRMSMAKQKAIVLLVLDSILGSKDASIDKSFGELVVGKVIKSTGNEITAFVVKGEK